MKPNANPTIGKNSMHISYSIPQSKADEGRFWLIQLQGVTWESFLTMDVCTFYIYIYQGHNKRASDKSEVGGGRRKGNQTRSCRYWNCNGCHGESGPQAIQRRFIAISILFIGQRWCDENGHPRAQQRKRAKLKVQSAGERLPLSSYLSLFSACALLHRARFGTDAFYTRASPSVFFVLSSFCTHSRREICFLAKDRHIPGGGYRKDGLKNLHI